MPESMRAIDIHNGTGPASALFINEDTPIPTLKAGDALVKVKAFGLNQMDLLQRNGLYPVPPQAPKTMGVEFSGTIAKAAQGDGDEDAQGFKEGDEVFGLAYGGAYAEYIAVSTHMLIHKPKEISWEVAAAISEVWITALQAIHLISNFQPNESILWHAGASSVSLAGIQLCKSLHASAIHVTASSAEKLSLCRSLGATHTWNYKTQDWASEIQTATGGKGVDVIVDFIGQNYFAGNLKAAGKDGRIVCLGLMSGTKLAEGTDMGPIIFKRLSVLGSTLRSRDVGYQKKLRDQLVKEVVPNVVKGEFEVKVETTLRWTEIAKAHEMMERGETRGKIVCFVE